MKKIYVIECNPKAHSSKEEYVKTYIEEAKKAGHEVRVVNVYDLNLGYLRAKDGELDFSFELIGELKEAQENLKWAEQLVFVYPIWYLAIPPILMDFITQVFGNIACELTEKGPKPLMKDKTAVIMQSYSMPYFCMKYFCKDVPMTWWKITLTDWCGPKIIKRFDFDMIDSVPEKRRQKWLKEIKKFVAKL